VKGSGIAPDPAALQYEVSSFWVRKDKEGRSVYGREEGKIYSVFIPNASSDGATLHSNVSFPIFIICEFPFLVFSESTRAKIRWASQLLISSH